MSTRDRIGIVSIRVMPAAMSASCAALCALAASQGSTAGTVLYAVGIAVFASLAIWTERIYRRVVTECRQRGEG